MVTSTPTPKRWRAVDPQTVLELKLAERLQLSATGRGAQMRGFATGVGSKTDIGARPVDTVPAWRAPACKGQLPGRGGRPQILLSEYPVTLAPALRWGLSYAESACVTDLN